MPLPITSVYAGSLALLLLVLSFHVIRHRWRAGVSLGDGGDSDLVRAIRSHGNFVEYTPISLILLALTELSGAPASAVHLIGGALLAGRILHPIGLVFRVSLCRQLGTLLTFLVLAFAGAGLIAHGLW